MLNKVVFLESVFGENQKTTIFSLFSDKQKKSKSKLLKRRMIKMNSKDKKLKKEVLPSVWQTSLNN